MRISLAIAVMLSIVSSGCADRSPVPATVETTFAVPKEQTPSYRPLPIPIAVVSKPSPLSCTIEARQTCMLGNAPNVRVSIVNETKESLYLVGCLDASNCKWRFPYCYFEVTGPEGQRVFPFIARCGNMNTLRVKDFVRVPPRAGFDPFQPIDPRRYYWSDHLGPLQFRKPGEYRIRFVYSTNCDRIADWAGDGRQRVASNQRIVELFKRVPKLELRSNEIKVNVVDRSK